MKKVLFFMLLILNGMAASVNAQVTIGEKKPPENFSVLELISNGTNGLRLPRMTTTQRDEISVAEQPLAQGLVIYNTTTNCFDFWNGSIWISLCAPTSIELNCGAILFPGSSVTVGSVPNEIIGVIPITGGTAPYSYQWQSCTDDPTVDGNWSAAAGMSTNANYQPEALSNTTYFRRRVTDVVGATCLSNVVKIQVTLVAGTITQPVQLPQGGGTVTINGTASTGGFSGTVYRQWEYCITGCNNDANWYQITDNNGGYNCANSGTELNYSSCTITGDMQIRRRDMDGEQAQVTNTVLVAVRTSNPLGTANDINASYTGGAVCQDSPVSFTVTLSPTVTNPVVTVYDTNGNIVVQSATAPFTFTVNPGIVPITNYYVAYKGTNYDENLPTDRKQVVIPVTEKANPTISIVSNATNNTITLGASVTFTATVDKLGGGTASYNWMVNGISMQKSQSNTYTTTSLTNGANVVCVLDVADGCTSPSSVQSTAIAFTVNILQANSCASCEQLAKSSDYSKTTYPYWGWQANYCIFKSNSGPGGIGPYVEWTWRGSQWAVNRTSSGEAINYNCNGTR